MDYLNGPAGDLVQPAALGEVLQAAAGIAAWTAKLPDEIRQDTEQILLEAAAAGADYGDLKIIATAATEAYRGQHPDPDEDGKFEDRYVHVDTTMDGARRITGDLTPECAAAVQAVLEAHKTRQQGRASPAPADGGSHFLPGFVPIA